MTNHHVPKHLRGQKFLIGVAAKLILVGASGIAILWHPYPIVGWLSKRYPDVLFAVDTQQRLVALTIDDGPNAGTTDQILEVLAANNAHATFFVVGRNIKGNEEIVRGIVSAGHELGNHLFTHRRSVRLDPREFEQELFRTGEIISAFGETPWFRPPSGLFSGRMIKTAKTHGYRCVLGSVYPFDPHIPSRWHIRQVIRHAVRPGAVVILHDGPRHGARTADVLREVLPELKTHGYTVVTISELVGQTKERDEGRGTGDEKGLGRRQ